MSHTVMFKSNLGAGERDGKYTADFQGEFSGIAVLVIYGECSFCMVCA